MIKELFKRSKSDELENLLSGFNNEVKRIKERLEQEDDIIKSYNDIKDGFISYIKKLFSVTVYVTDKEILETMSVSNINSDIIKKLKKIMDFMTEVDYSMYDFTKEDLYGLIEDCELIYEDIYSQRMADVLSKEGNISRLKKSIILKRFKNELRKIKETYDKNNRIDPKNVLKVTEYYEKLDHNNKDGFFKEYHYYCINLYHVLTLLNDLKDDDGNDVERTHLIISKINKIFFKLDDKERMELYPRLLKLIDSDEEKLNFYIFGGYEELHKKDFSKAAAQYPLMMQHYNNLEESKKPFYNALISRYMDNIRAALKKKEKEAKD